MSRSNINEGFWDSLVTQAKRGALAVGGAAGSKNAQGKLSALNLSTALYDAFKHYQGETGAGQTEEDMMHFLSKNLGFSDAFAEDQARRFENVINGYDYEDRVDDAGEEEEEQSGAQDQGQEQEAAPQADNDGRKEPTLGGEEPKAEQPAQEAKPQAQDAPQAEEKPAQEAKPAEEKPADAKQDGEQEQAEGGDAEMKEKREDSTERFMQTDMYSEMSMHTRGAGARSPEFVMVTPQNANKVKTLIDAAKADNKWGALANKLEGMGAMTSWANLQELLMDQGVEIPKSKVGMAEIMKDALNQAGKLLGSNYLRKANLFVVGLPEKPTGQEFKLRESVQLNEDLDDKELRDFFLKLSQNALKNGEAKSTAKRQIQSVKNRINNKNTGYRAPGSKSTTAQGAAGQSQQAPQAEKSTSASQPTQTTVKSTTATPSGLNVKLTKADKQLIDELDGTEIVDAIDSDIPDVKSLARKIIGDAIADYKSKK